MNKVIIAAPRHSVAEQERAHPRILRVPALLIVSRVPSKGKERKGFSETCTAPRNAGMDHLFREGQQSHQAVLIDSLVTRSLEGTSFPQVALTEPRGLL